MTPQPSPAEDRARHAQRSLYNAGVVTGRGGKQLNVFPSGTRPEVAGAIEDVIAGVAPAHTIEIGFAYGLSTIAIMLGAIRGGRAQGCFHTAIDPFASTAWHGAGIELLKQAGLRDRMNLLEEDSAIVLPTLVSERFIADLAFVDGGHLFENIFIDLYYLGRIVKPGGTILVDDLWMPAVRTAVAYFTTNLGWECTSVEKAKWLCSLKVPEAPAKRTWDHFVGFEQGRWNGFGTCHGLAGFADNP